MATKRQVPSEDNPAEKRGRGRPPAHIDEHLLLQMAQAHFTQEEIAAVMKISERTLVKKLRESPLHEIWERGKAMGRASLRRLQWKHAQMANSAGVCMSIHLSKHWLGETEKAAIELSGKNGQPFVVEVTARERLNSKLDTLSQRIESRIHRVAEQAGAERAPVGTD